MIEDRSILSRPGPPGDRLLRYGAHPDNVTEVWSGDARAATRPLVMIVHGGFWRVDFDRRHSYPMAAALRDHGYTVASVEYRREPGNPMATMDDVRAALASAPGEIGEHNGRVLLIGHSAGGQLVLWAASVAPPPGLYGTLGLAPVADMQLAYRLELDDDGVPAFLGAHPDRYPELDPAALPTPATAVTIVHGTEDAFVPIAVAEAYIANHQQTNLVRIPGTGHLALIDPKQPAWSMVVGELDLLAR